MNSYFLCLKSLSFLTILTCAGCGDAHGVSGAGGTVQNGTQNPNTTGTQGTTAGTGTAKGTVQGQTIAPKSTASATFFIKDGDYLLFVVSNQNNYCAATTAGQTHANHRSLVVILFSVDSEGKSSQALGAGTYTLSSSAPTKPGLYAKAAFNASDASCQSLLADGAGLATGGTVVITAVTSNAVTGTYSLQFGNDTLSGSFTAPDCLALADQASSGAELTCEP